MSRANTGAGPPSSHHGGLHAAMSGMRRVLKGVAERTEPADGDQKSSTGDGIPSRPRAREAELLHARRQRGRFETLARRGAQWPPDHPVGLPKDPEDALAFDLFPLGYASRSVLSISCCVKEL
jgi:hypothetical protein